jgi:hypothetical protein
MKNIQSTLSAINWLAVTKKINEQGFAQIKSVLSNDDCDLLIENYNNQSLYRKTITMERYRFGLGEYKYFKYPLPGLIQAIRKNVYCYLAPVANTWMKVLNIDMQFPKTFTEFQTLCRNNSQTEPTVLILKYGKGGHNTLHQDLYGDVFFPIQLVLFLSEADKDYSGGEFVLTQQIPRAQSKVIVLNPKKGDMILFTTNFRPVKGNKGYYRVAMKHGVSELHGGERHTLGIIFHDALN